MVLPVVPVNDAASQAGPPDPIGRKLKVFQLLAALCALAIGFATAELAARVLQLAAPVSPEADTAIVLHHTDPNGTIRLTPNWEGHVGFVKTRINANGFRDRLFSPEPPPGAVRIAILGDSYTMGDAVPEDATYPKQLEALLSDKGRTEVMNCGVSATNTVNQLPLLTEILTDYRPHLVVVGYNVNDFQWYRETRFQRLEKAGYSFAVGADGRVTVNRTRSRGQQVKQWVRDRSYFYRWLVGVRDAWTRRRQGDVEYDQVTRVHSWVAAGSTQSFNALRQMKELCAAKGVAFQVIVLPDLLDMPPAIRRMSDYPFRNEHELMHTQMRARGIDFVDLLPEFTDEMVPDLIAHPFDRHFSRHGNAIIARGIRNHLEARIDALRAEIGQ
jgi:hypothetical protein